MSIAFNIFHLFKKTFSEFIKDNAPQMAAALSYYALLAIPSLLLIILSMFNLFLADNQSRITILRIVSNNVGYSGTEAIKQIIEHLDQYSNQSSLASWVGIITLTIASTGLVRHMQRSLNSLWGSSSERYHLLSYIIKQRLFSILFIILIGITVFILFIANTSLSLLSYFIAQNLGTSLFVLNLISSSISFVVLILIIAGLYKYIPDGKMAWRDIFVGAFVTAILFSLGKYLIGIYLNYTTIGSLYGAAGSVLILLVWIYYISLIFFFGAEFTQIYANTHGQGIITADQKQK